MLGGRISDLVNPMSGTAKACLVQQRLTGDMSALCKYIRRINIRKGKEMVKLKDNIGSGGKGYKLIMNKLKVEDKIQFSHHPGDVLEQPAGKRRKH